RQLQDERRKLHNAERNAHLGTWEWDPRVDAIRLSETLHEIVGRPAMTHTTFANYLQRVHPEDREWVRAAWRPLIDEHKSVEVEHRYFCADSSALRIFHVYGSAVRDADGRVLLVGTAQDVTEQRAAVSRMERSSQ